MRLMELYRLYTYRIFTSGFIALYHRISFLLIHLWLLIRYCQSTFVTGFKSRKDIWWSLYRIFSHSFLDHIRSVVSSLFIVAFTITFLSQDHVIKFQKVYFSMFFLSSFTESFHAKEKSFCNFSRCGRRERAPEIAYIHHFSHSTRERATEQNRPIAEPRLRIRIHDARFFVCAL